MMNRQQLDVCLVDGRNALAGAPQGMRLIRSGRAPSSHSFRC